MDPDKLNDYYTDSESEKQSENPVTSHSSHSSKAAQMPNGYTAEPGKRTISFDTPENSGTDESTYPDKPVAKNKRHFFRKFMLWLLVIAVLGLTAVIYIRYFNPYISDAKVTGYVTNVERRGVIFKTYEGEMISQQKLADPNHIYSRDFFFTVPDDSLARQLQSVQGTGRPVTLTYDKYWGVLPWRGGSGIVITAIDTPPDNPVSNPAGPR